MPNKYYVLVQNGIAYVKEAEFFISQGGLVEDGGQSWTPIEAESIEDARQKAIVL